MQKLKLKRVLGFPSLFGIAVGLVVAQGVLVGILQGLGIGGATFFVSIMIAFVMTICYIFTYSELSLMMPKAGSFSSYTEVSIGHFPAIVGTLSAYISPSAFAGAAELFLLEYIFEALYPGTFSYLGVMIVVVLSLANLLGVDFFSKVQNLFAYIMIAALILLGIMGLLHSNPQGGSLSSIVLDLQQLDLGVFSLAIIALFAFVGFEFVCPMIEETKQPSKTIPRVMIFSAIVLLAVYFLISLAAYLVIPSNELAGSDIPHFIFVDAVFGEQGKLVLAILAVTATCSTLNTVLATLPRMLYGMAQNKQLPSIFKHLHPKTKVPWAGILLIAAILLVPMFLLRDQQGIILLMLISAGAVWILAYIISHINVMVLRKRYPDFARPYKTPWYPVPQILGIIGMIYMFINNSPTPEMTVQVYTNVGLIILTTGLYAAFWIKFKMKKDFFTPEAIEIVLDNDANTSGKA